MRYGDLTGTATGKQAVLAQYGSGANLRSRVSVYDYLEPGPPGQADIGQWALDHVSWSGTETALDLGCGSGASLPGLSQRAARVVAIDLSAGMVSEAREAAIPSVPTAFSQADAAHLGVRDGMFDVVLAAYMLYHVGDIPAALGEVRRALRPGGTALVPLNGAADKQQMRDLWQQAACGVLGPQAQVSRWSARANLDNMPELFKRYFGDVKVDRRLERFRFPTVEPVLKWIDSLRNGTEDVISDIGWAAVLTEVRGRAAKWISDHGELVVTRDAGLIIAR